MIKASLATLLVAVGVPLIVANTPAASAVDEDDLGWSCVDDGNRICGPGNPEGRPAGCYDDGGVLVAAWPCSVVIDPQTGDSDVYGPDDRPGHPSDVY
jgi:hypothetical protein